MKISVFDQGYTNLISNDTLEDWNELVDVLIDVKPGMKNGPYLTRGYCDGPRADTNMSSLDLIVIDGDSLIDKHGTCCPPDGVHELFKQKNITHCIHSSYSQNLVNSIFKWRMVIPCNDLVDSSALSQGVSEVISLLHENKFMVKNVREHLALSQPWFTPRCPEGFEDDFFAGYHDGEPWKLGSVPVIPTAKVTFIDSNNGNGNGTGAGFSWEWAINQLKSGTVHQAAKSICGWAILTTDWVPSQIKTYLITLISTLCPDPIKVKRATETKEIDNLIQYCREHHGIIENVANWKDHLITAKELKDKNFPPVVWAVDGIIPEGLTVLAGDPKVGKSLVAVDICSAIASGGIAFGNRQCTEGACLYVSLEDPERRVKARIEQQCNLWPERFKLLTGGISQLGEGFYRQMDEMLLLWPDLRCVVIDTMAFVIPTKPQGVSDYDHIYKYLDPLHRWCLNNHISIILITHTTKARIQDGENPFIGIIGSVAIQGCSDSMIMLRRNHAKAGLVAKDPDIPDGFLHVQGRELGTDVYALEFDDEGLKWAITREAEIKDVTANPNYLLIADCLKKEIKGPKEISSETQINVATVKTCLTRMMAKDILVKVSKGKYGVVGVDYGNIEPGGPREK